MASLTKLIPALLLTAAILCGIIIAVGSSMNPFVFPSTSVFDSSPALETISSLQPHQEMKVRGERAYTYLKRICELGPRPSGSAALEQHRILVEKHFTDLGAHVIRQPFQARHPISRKKVAFANIIASWNSERQPRILVAAHYDTRPYPDRDPNPEKRKAPFIGANDGASGVAVLMELAHFLNQINGPYGIDLILFDGEELVYDEQGTYFLGSRHFAREYRRNRQANRYMAGILVDMVGDRDLQIYQEENSLAFAPQLVASIWSIAAQLNIPEFIPRSKYEIRDDHLPLNTIANIPVCDLIDFDYPAWHTTRDTPEQCSPSSLEKVTRVVLKWLQQGT